MSKSAGTFACSKKALIQKGGALEWEFQGQRYAATRCAACGHVAFDPPTAAILQDYQENRYREVHASWYNLESDYNPGRWGEIGTYLISRFDEFQLANVALHEVECGFGGLVNWFQRRGIDATGSSWRADEVLGGRARGNRRIFIEGEIQLDDIRAASPSAVISIHKLQRSPSPIEIAKEIASYMGEETLGFIVVPNSMYLRAMREGYWAYDWFSFPDNLHYFSASSAMCLAAQAGLSIIDVSCSLREDDWDALGGTLTALRGGSAADERTTHNIVQKHMLGRELCFVVCKSEGTAYKKHAARIKSLRERQVETQRREDQLLLLLGAVD
jgi:hypothetical protein